MNGHGQPLAFGNDDDNVTLPDSPQAVGDVTPVALVRHDAQHAAAVACWQERHPDKSNAIPSVSAGCNGQHRLNASTAWCSASVNPVVHTNDQQSRPAPLTRNRPTEVLSREVSAKTTACGAGSGKCNVSASMLAPSIHRRQWANRMVCVPGGIGAVGALRPYVMPGSVGPSNAGSGVAMGGKRRGAGSSGNDANDADSCSATGGGLVIRTPSAAGCCGSRVCVIDRCKYSTQACAAASEGSSRNANVKCCNAA